MINPETLELLAKQCENDEQLERDIDCLIETTMLGGSIEYFQTQYTGEAYPMRKYSSTMHTKGYGYDPIPKYTTSMDAASRLIPIGGLLEFGNPQSQRWHWYLTNVGYNNGVWLEGKSKAVVYHPLSSGPESYVGIASTPARAMAAAALRAHADFIRAGSPPEPKADQPC